METAGKKARRRRRTKIEVEKDIWDALERLIRKKNIHNITIVELAQEARVEPIVLYNRFKNLDELIEKYVRQYDYWLKDVAEINWNAEPKSEFKKMLTNFTKGLYESEIMQRMLVWELHNDSEVNRETAQMREMQSVQLFEHFNKQLQNGGSGFNAIIAVLVAGIYYLVLHRKISTFVFIDFDTEAGRQLLIDAVEEIVDFLIFPKDATVSHENPQSIRDVAQNMLDLGVEKEIIARSTGLTDREINKLKRQR
ncbi:MAG: TetR/AcrR family transcriptional regulator [Prevotellaceae bacterium]|jgi:AcrR family transcriptional regulator|nr:TetR/AcrR family transcriptional regulator [Prevotellaceae bacterium]